MAENYLIGMAEEIKSYIPGTSSIEEGDSKITINAELKTGIKGISIAIECAPNTVKIKGTQEYKYPISEESVEEFQQEMMEKYSGCNVYVSGQVFAFSKFFSYQTVEEAVKTTEEIIDAMQDAVVTFENDCVNFLEKDVEAKEEDYNPEENVNLVHVDNAYHAVSTTMQDTEDYEEEHRKFAEKIFRDLAAEIGGTLNGNEVILTDEKEKITTDCIFFPLDAEILVSVSTPADNDAGTIYVSYINANYPELMAAYDADNEVFKVRTYSSPDKYAPDETKERLDLCRTALVACMKEYERTLKKKDSADFASDVQQILSEQTAMVSEREKAVAERENEMEQKEKEMQKKEAELQKQVAVLEEERAALQEKIKSEEAKVKEHEEEMQNKIKEYEERDTKNILNLQQLAKQLAALQDRQNALGKTDNEAEEEVFRMKQKVQQLVGQKIALEKKLTEKIVTKESKIKELSDSIGKKDREIKKIESNIEDMVKSQVADEVKKVEERAESIQKQLDEIGHILTPEDLISYYEQYSDAEIKKFHAPNAEFVVYNDGALEVRIRIGETNYVEVSRSAALKDQILRKLNTKYNDVKFYSTKDDRIAARSYFKKNAAAEDVDDIVASLSENFKK